MRQIRIIFSADEWQKRTSVVFDPNATKKQTKTTRKKKKKRQFETEERNDQRIVPGATDVCLELQFIWYENSLSPSNILGIFDLDCCMFAFNGKDALATYGALQSVRTQTMINYKLIRDPADFSQFLPRTVKYHQRGFRLLVPHDFDCSLIKTLERAPREEEKGNIKGDYAGFLLNNDSFEIRKRFVGALGLADIHTLRSSSL